jgi:hypothetical protein
LFKKRARRNRNEQDEKPRLLLFNKFYPARKREEESYRHSKNELEIAGIIE